MFLAWNLLIFILIGQVNNQCLDKASPELPCLLCISSYFDSTLVFTNISTQNNCYPKINESLVSKILIVANLSLVENFTSFDYVYSDIIEAFLNEEKKLIQFNQSNITFYFSKGMHLIQKNSFLTRSLIFDRVNTTIYLKPLFCVEFPIHTLCVEDRSQIFLNDIFFSLIISNTF